LNKLGNWYQNNPHVKGPAQFVHISTLIKKKQSNF